MENERLTLNVTEAAKLLGISRGTAYEAIRMGKIPVIKLGRRLLVPRKALMNLLEKDTGTEEKPAAQLEESKHEATP